MTEELLDFGFASSASSPGADSGASINSVHIDHSLPLLGDNGGAVVDVEPSSDIENLNLQHPATVKKRKAVEEGWVANKKPRMPLYITS